MDRALVGSALGDPLAADADPAALAVVSLPRPALKKGEVRIAVAAAGLNFADLLQVRGKWRRGGGARDCGCTC